MQAVERVAMHVGAVGHVQLDPTIRLGTTH